MVPNIDTLFHILTIRPESFTYVNVFTQQIKSHLVMTKVSDTGGTVGKAFEILDIVTSLDRPVRFSELLKDSPHPKATLYRFLQTLTSLGLLFYDSDSQSYSAGLRLVRLAHASWRQASLAPVARPFIDELSSKVGETVHLAQMDKGQVVYMDKRQGTSPIDMYSQAGKIGPGYCTGIGKAIMAFMPTELRTQAMQQQSYFRYTANTLTSLQALNNELNQIRENGIAYDREEHESGIICIAAPILAGSKVIGGLSITTGTHRLQLEDLDKFRPLLQTTAKNIGHEAGNWQFPNAN